MAKPRSVRPHKLTELVCRVLKCIACKNCLSSVATLNTEFQTTSGSNFSTITVWVWRMPGEYTVSTVKFGGGVINGLGLFFMVHAKPCSSSEGMTLTFQMILCFQFCGNSLGEGLSCFSMTMLPCTKRGPYRNGLSRSVWKNLTGLRRALTSTPSG
jgi:hypothetical protein